MSSAEAAPLLSSGLTAYSALQHAAPGAAIGVVGIGSLGHLALQIAAKRGCIVTAISSSAKEMSTKELGAEDFIDVAKAKEAAAGSLDFILVTDDFSDANGFDASVIKHLLAPEGTICFVEGSGAASVQLDLQAMARRGQRVVTAAAGGRRDMEPFLRFVRAHGIKARVETTPIANVNGAIAKLRANEARYSVVIEGSA